MVSSIFAALLDIQSIVLDCLDPSELLNYLHRRSKKKLGGCTENGSGGKI